MAGSGDTDATDTDSTKNKCLSSSSASVVFKDLPIRIQTAKLTSREDIFAQLQKVTRGELPEPVVKRICHILLLTLPRYNDSKSRSLVEKYIQTLVKWHPISSKYFIAALHDVTQEYKGVHATRNTSKTALSALLWSTIVANSLTLEAGKCTPEEVKQLVVSQSCLLTAVVGARSPILNRRAYKKLSLSWKKGSTYVERYITVLSSLEPSFSGVILWGFLIKFLAEIKALEVIARNKPHVLDLFIKVVLGSKVKPPIPVLEHSKSFLKQVLHDDFRQFILPALQKAVLRNPEIILETVGHILSGLSLDLSAYAADLGKSIATHLCSKDDQCREDAITACRNLAQQCSNSQAIEDLLKHFIGVLNGSEGKLTVVTQRLGVISGIGSLSHHTVSGSASVQLVSEGAAEMFISVLKQEVHEGILVHTLNMLSLWCARFTTEVPNSLLNWFKESLSLKTSTSAVRNAYIQCMNTAFHGNMLHQAIQLIPILLKIVDKGMAQSSQLSVVAEGLGAACILLRIFMVDAQTENRLKNLVSGLLETDKHPFLSEKFLCSAGDSVMTSVLEFIERLVLDHSEPLNDKMGPINRALLFGLTRPSIRVRQQAQVTTRKLLSALGGTHIACSILRDFPNFVQQLKIQDKESKESEGTVDGSDSAPATVVPNILVECLITLCSGSNLDFEDQEKIAIDSLFPSSLPVVAEAQPDLWVRLLRKLHLHPYIFIKNNKDKLIEKIIKVDTVNPTVQNAVKILVKIALDEVAPPVVGHITKLLTDPELCQVTQEDYNIFITPEGELYDKSVIESLKEDMNCSRNIKRESKLYSYKEQLEELELRKELEEKKRAKGLTKEPELTKKQLTAKKLQLEKEAKIRTKIQKLHDELMIAMSLLSATIDTVAMSMAEYAKELIFVLIPLFSSPLCAPVAVQAYFDLRLAVWEESLKQLGYQVAIITLRVLQPACPLNPSWTEEDQSSALERGVGLLFKRTCRPTGSYYDEQASAKAVLLRLTGPAFSYCFPLFRCVLLDSSSTEGIIVQILQLISEHAQMRKSTSEEEEDDDEYHDPLKTPEHLPRKHMLEILIKLIAMSSGKIQILASKALLDVATLASGLQGCVFASQAEIDILLNALLSPEEAVREAALRGLLAMLLTLPTLDNDYNNGLHVMQRVWVAKFDSHEDTKNLAERLWEESEMQLSIDICTRLLSDVIHPEIVVRQAAAEALGTALQQYPQQVYSTMLQLIETYKSKLHVAPPVLDSFGRVIAEAPPDDWEPRSGIAMALGKMAPLLKEEMVSELVAFFVPDALGDRHVVVRKDMLDAALAIVDVHGKDSVNVLLPLFEEFLDETPDASSYDNVRQSVVILMGTLARHLDKNDPKVKTTVVKLIETLTTPSQQVQEAVANCLPPLVPAIKDNAPHLVHKLLELLLEAENYGERKGAAYGLAGLVKGLGILSLKQLDIMTTLTTAIQNKKSHRHREGALFAFEMLCNMLGRLFEPYIVHVLPHLLLCFGDTNQYVREATDDTAKAVMSKLSAHGVKLVLPSLLSALEEDSWRTKAGSVELLGAMAFCAPKQLSSCLPSIVPKLIEVLSDSHMKVQKAGAQALRLIGSVIRNPEIQAIVPILLDALQDPAKKTSTSLATLLDTKFVHVIDAPSLALIMPVVQRGFQDRSTETRKMAAQIIGNMYSLTDEKDLHPYLPTITPGLKQCLLDPVPEVRSVSARALGAMVKGMGESKFEDLLPWLMQTLTSENSAVDRSGAAQGLSEVMGGLGVEKLQKLMPDIIATAERSDIAPHVKDGYIMMFIYLPVVFNREFTPYIGQIINPILKALADENEFVRETALKAGQRIVNMYADTAIALLLPELENGLFDDNWRIRYSSIQLLGDLLYKISGVSGKMSTETADEDDNFGTEQSHKAILQALGAERRNRVLAGLYMGRSDVALMVRQAALHVWKVVVTNTPRTLREILPTLFSLLLGCLASNSYDKRQVAARTLGDLVRKLGERVLPEIIPILENGLDSDRADQRQGVCIGLSEIMASTSREMVFAFVDSLVPTVRRALCDPLPDVRQAAAKTFDSLHSTVGVRALDDILPPLLVQLSDPELGEYTLDGLRQVMAIKSRVVLPYLVPQLTSPPVNTKALSLLSAVAGDSLSKHLGKILPALLAALSDTLDTPAAQQQQEYCQTVVLTVTDELGVRTVVDHLLEAARADSVRLRRASIVLLCAFCSQTKADLSNHVSQLLRGLIHLFTDRDPRVLQWSGETLLAVTRTLDANAQLQHVSDVRQAIRFAVSDLKGQDLLPGFCLPKGITPILPIFREALLNGLPEVKEQAAQGLGEVIRLTSAEALKTSVVHITGPLIRILGDRFNWNVKVAVLETLALLLAKVGVMLKPFQPQLQTTFLKALGDSHRLVRLRAAAALSHFIAIHTRCDTLFTELHTAVKSTEDPSIKETMLHALRCMITPAGEKMSDTVRRSIIATTTSMLGAGDDTCRTTAAGCLGALCKCLSEDELGSVAREYLLDDDPSKDWMLRHGCSVALMVALKEASNKLVTSDWSDRITRTLIAYMTADRLPIALSGIRGTGYYLRYLLDQSSLVPQLLVITFAKSMNHSSNEVKQVVPLTSSYLAKVVKQPLPGPFLKTLLPHLVNGTKEKNTVVRANSEFALMAILRLRSGDEMQQVCLNLLEPGARDALQDVVNKVLRKVASQPEPKEEELDDTLLT